MAPKKSGGPKSGTSSRSSERASAEKKLAKATAQVEKLRSTVETLETRLAKSKDKAARWKAEARQERTKVAKLEAKLRRAERDAPVDREPPSARGDLPVEDPTVPDDSWTVARLRQLAREKQVVGASRLTKARLLEVLRG